MIARKTAVSSLVIVAATLAGRGLPAHAQTAPALPPPESPSTRVSAQAGRTTLGAALFGFERERGPGSASSATGEASGRYSAPASAGMHGRWLIQPGEIALETGRGSDPLVRLRLVGADPRAAAVEGAERPGLVNRIIGGNPAAWTIGARRYESVSFREVLPGVGIRFYDSSGSVEFDLELEEDAELSQIAFAIDGAGAPSLDLRGDLVIEAAGRRAVIRRPVVHERSGGRSRDLEARFSLSGRTLRFETGVRTPGSRLVVDPVLVYATVLGGTSVDNMWGAGVDSSGNVFICGNTGSSDFPATPGSWDGTLADPAGDAFVAMLSPDASTLVWATFIGGNFGDNATALDLDGSGNVYVVGQTTGNATNTFPVTGGAYDLSPSAFGDGFVLKLAAGGGSLVYSTFYSGTGNNLPLAIAVNGAREAIVAGATSATDLPLTPGAFRSTHSSGTFDSWVARFDATGSALLYASYLGGADYITGIALDSSGRAVISGYTNLSTFAVTPGAYDTMFASASDGFVQKVDTTLSGAASLVWGTYLGGNGGDQIFGIKLGPGEDVYVTGSTASSDFPTTPGAFDRTQTPFSNDAFVAHLGADGASLVASTLLGSGSSGFDVAVDPAGFVAVTGTPGFGPFPTTPDALSTTVQGNGDAFLTRFVPGLTSLASSTYFGGTANESPQALFTAGTDEVVMVGRVSDPGGTFPATAGAWDTAIDGFSDAFAARFQFAPFVANVDLALVKTASPDPATQGQSLTYTLTVTNNGTQDATLVSVADTLPAGVTFVSAGSGCAQASGTVTCNLGTVPEGGGSAARTITVTPLSPGVVTNSATASSFEADANAADNTDMISTPVAAVSHDFAAGGTGAGVTCQPAGKKQVCTIVQTLTFQYNGADYFVGALDVTSTCKKIGTPSVSCKMKGALDIVTFNLAGVPPHDISAYVSADGLVDPGDRLVAAAPTTLLALLAPKGKAVKIKYNHPTGQAYTGQSLLLKADAAGIVPESNESNNTIVIGPLP